MFLIWQNWNCLIKRSSRKKSEADCGRLDRQNCAWCDKLASLFSKALVLIDSSRVERCVSLPTPHCPASLPYSQCTTSLTSYHSNISCNAKWIFFSFLKWALIYIILYLCFIVCFLVVPLETEIRQISHYLSGICWCKPSGVVLSIVGASVHR